VSASLIPSITLALPCGSGLLPNTYQHGPVLCPISAGPCFPRTLNVKKWVQFCYLSSFHLCFLGEDLIQRVAWSDWGECWTRTLDALHVVMWWQMPALSWTQAWEFPGVWQFEILQTCPLVISSKNVTSENLSWVLSSLVSSQGPIYYNCIDEHFVFIDILSISIKNYELEFQLNLEF
jgi:hypothetical protein